VSVEKREEREDVYNVTVEGYHNLAISSQVVTGSVFTFQSGDILDVEYFRDLFFAGTRVPKGYMGFEDSQGYRGTDTLSAQSIKFARGVKRLQRHFLQGLTRLCKIHLALVGRNPDSPENAFTLEMTPVSYLDEAHKAELYAKRFEAVGYMLDIGERMASQFGGRFNTQGWAVYVLKEFGQFDDSTISNLLTATPEGGADLTFAPQGSAFKFEGMTSDDIRRLNDSIQENDELRDVVSRSILPADMEFQSKWSSGRERSGGLREVTKAKFDSREFDRVLEKNDQSEIRVIKERRGRLRKDLKILADVMQEKYGDSETE